MEWTTCLAFALCAAATDALHPAATDPAAHFAYDQPRLDYSPTLLNATSYVSNAVVRPASYTFFSSGPASTSILLTPPTFHRHHVDDYQAPQGNHQQAAYPENPTPVASVQRDYAATRQHPLVEPYATPAQYRAPDYDENRNYPVLERKPLRFPLNTVLPGNSLKFDHRAYPGLLRAVDTFSDLTPRRNPDDAVIVSHDAVTRHTDDGLPARTRLAIDAGYGRSGYIPYREYAESTHDARGDRGGVVETTQHFKVHQGADEDPAESFALFKTGHSKHGGGGGGSHQESAQGEYNGEDHHTVKGGKGKKGYKKDHEHHKGAKGHHDTERDSGEFEENENKEKKYHKDEGFYGEHHKTEKGGKGKKYGGGGKHKKGHTTHGEHNIIKKDEFIKNTKFYDEDHGGGEHEEHGEFYDHHEEKKGGNKEGGHKESDYIKKNAGKKGHHDKGHVDEEHLGHDSGAGHEDHFEHNEEYGSKKGGHQSKKWSQSSGDKH